MELMGTSPKIDLYSHPLFLGLKNERREIGRLMAVSTAFSMASGSTSG